MSLSTSFDVDQKKVAKKDLNEGCLQCPKCSNTWFEEVRAMQFQDDHNVILSQGVPPKNGLQFVLLRCTKCSEMVEPRLLRNNRDTANALYESFVDSMKSEIRSEKV